MRGATTGHCVGASSTTWSLGTCGPSFWGPASGVAPLREAGARLATTPTPSSAVHAKVLASRAASVQGRRTVAPEHELGLICSRVVLRQRRLEVPSTVYKLFPSSICPLNSAVLDCLSSRAKSMLTLSPTGCSHLCVHAVSPGPHKVSSNSRTAPLTPTPLHSPALPQRPPHGFSLLADPLRVLRQQPPSGQGVRGASLPLLQGCHPG
jgi:hypothetical protein